VKPFVGSDAKEFKRGGTMFSTDPKCRRGAEEADAALKLTKDGRLNLVVVLDSTDEDEAASADGDSDDADSDFEQAMEVDETPNNENDDAADDGSTDKMKPSKSDGGKENKVYQFSFEILLSRIF